MSDKKELLISEDKLLEMLDKVNNQEYLMSLSDSELLFLRSQADILYALFNNIQIGTKLLCNAIYGGLGTNLLRYYNTAVASDITAEGREACKLMDRTANRYFHKIWATDYEWHKQLNEKFPMFFKNVVIGEPLDISKMRDVVPYCDTDSNYVAFDDIFVTLGLDPYVLPTKETTEFMTYFMKTKLDPIYDKVLTKYIEGRNGKNTMIFELEAIGGFGIWVAKKKYVFAKLWEDGKYIADQGKLKVVGLEIKQKSASKRVKDILKTFVNTIFVKRGKIDSVTFFKMCLSVKQSLHDATIDDLAKATKLNNYDKYILYMDENRIEYGKQTPFTVKGSARYNQALLKSGMQSEFPKLKDGMFVKVYYDESGLPFTYPADYDVPPFAPKLSVDIQLEKLVFNPIKRLAEGMIDGDLSKMGESKVQMGFNKLMNKFKK